MPTRHSIEFENDDYLAKYQIAVVLDVLRATTNIITALKNGCLGVIPVIHVAETKRLASTHSKIIIGGERNAVKLSGFHLGNSPLEYSIENVKDQLVALTTTNGTATIKVVAQKIPQVLIGSMLNATALANHLVLLNKNILFACAGTKGKFSLEDTLGAGYIIKKILLLKGIGQYHQKLNINKLEKNTFIYNDESPRNHNHPVILDDLAVTAYRLALYYGDDIITALYDSLHGQKLAQMGLVDDLLHCAQLNICNLIPSYEKGIIINTP